MADKTQEYIAYIQSRVSRSELLAQLAEESAELAQAALKLRRAITDENPTPITFEEAKANLNEERADVNLVLNIIEMRDEYDAYNDEITRNYIMDEKAERWAKRLGYEEPKRGDHNDMCVQHSTDCLCNTCMRDGMCDRCHKTPTVVGGCRITRCNKYRPEES